MNESNAIVQYSLSDIKTMAVTVANSGLFGVKTPDQAMALMLISQANGEHPARAAQQYSIIQGKAAMNAQAMLAKFQQAGGKVRWIERNDAAVEAEFIHDSGGSLKVRWTMEQAKKIGLSTKDNWKNYPRQMLSARVISEGVRAVLPGCILGFYAPEELADIEPPRQHEKPAPLFAKVVEPEQSAPVAVAAEIVTPPQDNRAKLAEIVGDDTEAAVAVCKARKMLAEGQTLADLGEHELERCIANADKFRLAIDIAKKGGAA